MRVLGRIRLSRSTEESTSVERQRELIENWAKLNEHEIIGWASDIYVSGSLSPFDTPELGKWLTDSDKVNQWDILVAWKLDRLARNAINMNLLFKFMIDNDKSLVCINENIDLSTWVGRLVANVIAGVAEGELEAITERITAAKQKVRELGRWTGGAVPYGWQPVKLPTGGWKLEHHPEHQPILQEIIRRFIGHATAGTIARDLNSRGILSPRGGEWDGDGIRQLLDKRSLLGYQVHNGVEVKDSNGEPVMVGTPAVDKVTFRKIQDELKRTSFTKERADETSPLLYVLRCPDCTDDTGNPTPLHVRRTTTKAGTVHTSYRCRNGCTRIAVNGDAALVFIYALIEVHLQGETIKERLPAITDELQAQLDDELANHSDFTELLRTTRNQTIRNGYLEALREIEIRVDKLEDQLSKSSPHDQWVDTGVPFLRDWHGMNREQRRLYLIDNGITFLAEQKSKGNRHRFGDIALDMFQRGEWVATLHDDSEDMLLRSNMIELIEQLPE